MQTLPKQAPRSAPIRAMRAGRDTARPVPGSEQEAFMKGIRTWSMAFTILGLACLGAVTAWARQAQTQPSSPAAPAAPAPPPVFDPSKSDEKALAIADQTMSAMGNDAWSKAHYIKFTFVVKKGETRSIVRTHYWDRFGQRSRMEGPSRDGKPVVAVVDHKTHEGQATVDGQLLFDKDAKKYVDIAYGSLINDSYWLFMSFKLKDPGVRLRYEGDLKTGSITYDKIQLSFDDGIGLTSKDKYWLYVNRANHTIERWSYVLEGQGASAAPTAWDWTDWTDVGGMKLAMRKTQPGGDVEIVLENVQVPESLPESVFTGTAAVAMDTHEAKAPSGPSGE